MFINCCTWAHILLEAARVLAMPREGLLAAEELAALEGKAALSWFWSKGEGNLPPLTLPNNCLEPYLWNSWL
jgi:hypothetical protein